MTKPSMPRFSLAVAVLLTTLAPLPAQKRLGARSFFPVDFDVLVEVDMDALVETGLWGGVERSVLRPALTAFARERGFDLADTTRITYASKFVDDTLGHPDQQYVWVFEGGPRVSLERADPMVFGPGGGRAEIAGHRVLRDGRITWVALEGCVVDGSATLVEPILRGAATGGVPSPDLTALVAGPRSIAQLAGRIPRDDAPHVTRIGFPAGWSLPEAPVEYVRLGLDREGEDGLQLELLARFAQDGDGPRHFEQQLTAAIATARELPEARPFRAALEGVRVQRDGADVRARASLGSAEKMLALIVPAIGWLTLSADTVHEVRAGPGVVVPPERVGPAKAPPEKPDRDRR